MSKKIKAQSRKWQMLNIYVLAMSDHKTEKKKPNLFYVYTCFVCTPDRHTPHECLEGKRRVSDSLELVTDGCELSCG